MPLRIGQTSYVRSSIQILYINTCVYIQYLAWQRTNYSFWMALLKQ
ncbi:Uncharacterised protein [Klebsiella michiganensis]|nr:Uncharacterised protein [Klebsiella michiganensis]